MASRRKTKKVIDYLINEVISDCYMAMYFHPDKKEAAIGIVEEAVGMRNELIDRTAKPVEKNNKSLVKKHYAQLNKDILSSVDSLFEKLSAICK